MNNRVTLDVGPVDLYVLSFGISVGDLNPDLWVNNAYYHEGQIMANWLDGIGRKGGGAIGYIDETSLAKNFKAEKLESAKRIFASRAKHQKSMATWFCLDFQGNITYLIIRQNKPVKPFYLEYFSRGTSVTEVSFSQMDEFIEKINGTNMKYAIPKTIIKDLLRFVAALFDAVEPDISSIKIENNVLLLSRGNKMIQIHSSEKSKFVYIYSWEQPKYGAYKIPKFIHEKIPIERLEPRLAYYKKSGYLG